MKYRIVTFIFVAPSSPIAASSSGSAVTGNATHAFNVRDLVMMDRVNDPQLSLDGHHVAFGLRSTDYAANKGVSAVYTLDLAAHAGKDSLPVKVLDKGGSARWSADGRGLYELARV